MKTIALFNSKGGAGKSTLSIHLAVSAAEHMLVGILDLDSAGSETASLWSRTRDQGLPPRVKGSAAQTLKADLAEMKAVGAELVILDCPPSVTVESALFVAHADFVVIPVQPTMPDVGASHKAVRIVQSQGKPFAFVLNSCPPSSPETQEAIEGLSQAGELCPILIGDRIAFSRALKTGNAVTEMARSGKAYEETVAACNWILSKIGVMENAAQK